MLRSVFNRQSLCRTFSSLRPRCYEFSGVPRTVNRMMASSTDSYVDWSREDLVQRVRTLEQQLKDASDRSNSDNVLPKLEDDKSSSSLKGRPTKKPKIFDWSRHSTRFIALKFAYLGRRYNGFEHHVNNTTPLPTVEETLWHALMKAKLINPTGATSNNDTSSVNWEGCDYSKCGRTDKGVSAFGQVVGLRVRTNRPVTRTDNKAVEEGDQVTPGKEEGNTAGQPAFDDLNDEMPYIQILNALLPPDIRVLAWCPAPPEGFSARFSCRARHYKYFFTQPAYMPTPGPPGLRHGPSGATGAEPGLREGWLDIARMQEGAKRFEGLHDFRNFCKIDPSKQITDHRRRMFKAEIRALTPEEQPAAYISNSLFARSADSTTNSTSTAREGDLTPQIYFFDLQGSAFLWHQVRHMISILFLIGQGLEAPTVIDQLLDAEHCPEKPVYEIADDSPLVLWNCMFPGEGEDADPLQDSLQWIYAGEMPASPHGKTSLGLYGTKYGLGGAVDTTWSLWRESHMDTILRGSMLDLIARQPDVHDVDRDFDHGALSRKPFSQKVFHGAPAPLYRGTYIPLMKRERVKSVEVQNSEYAAKRGILPKPKANREPPPERRADHMDIEP